MHRSIPAYQEPPADFMRAPFAAGRRQLITSLSCFLANAWNPAVRVAFQKRYHLDPTATVASFAQAGNYTPAAPRASVFPMVLSPPYFSRRPRGGQSIDSAQLAYVVCFQLDSAAFVYHAALRVFRGSLLNCFLGAPQSRCVPGRAAPEISLCWLDTKGPPAFNRRRKMDWRLRVE